MSSWRDNAIFMPHPRNSGSGSRCNRLERLPALGKSRDLYIQLGNSSLGRGCGRAITKHCGIREGCVNKLTLFLFFVNPLWKR
jgi:hypothetical protein